MDEHVLAVPAAARRRGMTLEATDNG